MWGGAAELNEALAAYQRFVTDYVVAEDGTVRGDSGRTLKPRLYNFPWFARFLLDQGDVDRAVLIIDRYYALGGDHFLGFDLGSIMSDLHQRLTESGRGDEAIRLGRHRHRSCDEFLEPR